MPYHDPFQHQHLFDLGPSPSVSSVPSVPGRSHATFNPTTRPPRARGPLLNLSTPQPNPEYVISATSAPPPMAAPRQQAQTRGTNDRIASYWFNNSTAKRVNTDVYIYEALKRLNPEAEVLDTDAYQANIFAYVSFTGDGEIKSLSKGMSLSALLNDNAELAQTRVSNRNDDMPPSPGQPDSMRRIDYYPPFRRMDGGKGLLAADPLFERFIVKWHGHEFEVYIVDSRDGDSSYPMEKRQFIVTVDPGAALTLVREVGSWQNVLHDQIWVFDQGWWQMDSALYAAIQKSDWKDIILPELLKEDLLKTVLRFYDSRETYTKLRVPWKRGLIFYGPPGNGKTVTIKATMKTLLDRKESIPTLYVKSLASFGGPEYSIGLIFEKARQQAPCYLVFEDLDSLVNDEVRSFFLNAVDGLSENEGILMVGSTNHLERLDPGIAKRPSRFDRKYLFPDPAMAERKRYCQYWQKKLEDNDAVKFPDKLLEPIAGLMDNFSFAYMQEAFVSTLLKIANDQQGNGQEDEHWDLVEGVEELEIVGKDKGGDDDGLDKYILWREIKVQIANLRKELGDGKN